jgi:beta-lactam-binding protein with PASTA domain
MSLKKFLTSRVFLKHLIAALLLIVLLLVIVFKWMKVYTHHGVSYAVPALIGLDQKNAAKVAAENNLRIAIIDSVYNHSYAPGVVVDQLPLKGFKVKQNRVINLTINSSEPEKIVLPQLTDISLRQAQALVEKYGLFVQNITYEPSEYDNLVLKVMKDSVLLSQGDKIVKGEGVDLVIGRSHGNMKTDVPNLLGFTLDEAQAVICDANLNVGVLIYDKNVKSADDSIAAKIWKQMPLQNVQQIDMGTSVDLWLTADSLRVENAYERDSL